ERFRVPPEVWLLPQTVNERRKLRRLARHVLCRKNPELHLVNGEEIFDVLDLRDRVLDLAVDDILDRQRVDDARVRRQELEQQLRRVREGRMHHRQVYLLRSQDDEATIDLVWIEIMDIAKILGHLRRK